MLATAYTTLVPVLIRRVARPASISACVQACDTSSMPPASKTNRVRLPILFSEAVPSVDLVAESPARLTVRSVSATAGTGALAHPAARQAATGIKMKFLFMSNDF